MKKGLISKNLMRILSGVVLFPIFAVFLIFANNIVMDVFLAIISIICLYEYYNCFKSTGKANPSSYVGYLVNICVMAYFICNSGVLGFNITINENILYLIFPTLFLALVIELIISKGQKTIVDIAITLLGILYIPFMILFLVLIRQKMNMGIQYGKMLIWYVFIASWASDVFAYFIGKKFGKHKFTKISPNKTIEGCIAGVVGAVLVGIVFTILINKFYPYVYIISSEGISIWKVSIIILILSVVGQIGDLAASSIKRYCGIKDFGDIIPGHGGMLDRIDSVIFILPFAYLLLTLL